MNNQKEGTVWDLPIHHPRSPFQSRELVDWVFSRKCEGCETLIKRYLKRCNECEKLNHREDVHL
jgi:hypothetical protein